MGFFDWLCAEPRFRKFEDSYAIDPAAKLDGLKYAIAKQLPTSNSIWIVVHFPDTFLQLQSFLETSEIDYFVAQRAADLAHSLGVAQVFTPLNASTEFDPADALPTVVPRVVLVMSSLLSDETAGFVVSELVRQQKQTTKVAVMVCERHPLPACDKSVVTLVRRLPMRVSLGYLLSLDDSVVRQVVSSVTRTVLDNLGMNNRELVASNFVTRRLNKVLTRQAERYVASPVAADNADEWMRINLKLGS